MLDSDIDSGSSSGSECQPQPVAPQSLVSILRHLPEARKIMQGNNYEHQSTNCMYTQPLSTNPGFLVPKIANTQAPGLTNNRLVKLEDVAFEHENMKDKIKALLQKEGRKQGETATTLWTLYGGVTPVYARFGLTARKNNFANVLMPINGVNIVIGSKYADRVPESDKSSLPQSADSIRFDSHFESGNLLYAYRHECLEVETYDLILQNDTNTKGHNQWFYFKVQSSRPHNRIRFNINNFTKDESMFSYGIKPLAFSERDHSRHRIGWVRGGEKVLYYPNQIRRQCNGKTYYSLSFEYYFREADTVYFAPVHPYTYTQLTDYFDAIMAQHSLSNFVSIKSASETVGRNVVSVVTISSGRKLIKDCNVVWVLGRQHPGEATSSFMAEGIINYLIALYANPTTSMAAVLDNLIFKIVPMLNVDGVVHGNTRSELTGVDPNRIWKKTVKRLSPGVSAVKKLIAENKQNVKLVLDLHSHSKKLGCFFYGNSLMHDPKKTKIYPILVCESDDRFELRNCRFRGGYETTARSVLFHDLGIKQVYTVECSLLGYLKKNRITEYKIADYHDMGRKLIECFIQLENNKQNGKTEKQILAELPQAAVEREDAESARSQSSLSDEEYDQIKNKKKKKKRKLVKNQNQNTTVPTELNTQNNQIKYFIRRSSRNNTRVEMSMNNQKKKNPRRELSSNELCMQNENLPKAIEVKICKQLQNKKSDTLGIKDMLGRANLSRKNADNTTDQSRAKANLSLTKVRLNTLNDRNEKSKPRLDRKQVQTQVGTGQDLRNFESRRYGLRNKNQNSLCVVGSSLEDDQVYVYKNEVGLQADHELIYQAIQAASQVSKKSMKVKKVPKLLNYICSNLIGSVPQNALLPQQRRLLPLPTKKLAQITKN